MLTLANINTGDMFCLCCMPVPLYQLLSSRWTLRSFWIEVGRESKEWDQFIPDFKRYQCDPNFKMIFDECDVFFLKNLQEHCYCAMSYECKVTCWNCTVRDHHPRGIASPEGLRALSEFQSSFSHKRRQSSVSMLAFKGCMFPVEEEVSWTDSCHCPLLDDAVT